MKFKESERKGNNMICYYCMCPMVEVTNHEERYEALEDFDFVALDDEIEVVVYKCPECEGVEVTYDQE